MVVLVRQKLVIVMSVRVIVILLVGRLVQNIVLMIARVNVLQHAHLLAIEVFVQEDVVEGVLILVVEHVIRLVIHHVIVVVIRLVMVGA